uniref:Uncharacterized protein n=1 Tax=Arundo donax TaxID=35708 RepID=A0A0A9BHZ3_ARUDO
MPSNTAISQAANKVVELNLGSLNSLFIPCSIIMFSYVSRKWSVSRTGPSLKFPPGVSPSRIFDILSAISTVLHVA